MNREISNLLDEVTQITKHYDKISDLSGQNFNIFSILQAESNEAKTHSNFIGELLNPNGSHGQGKKFLREFVKLFDIQGYNLDEVKVLVEYKVGSISYESIEGGRIDILIKNHKNDYIIIENKIYAHEQYKQLERYHNSIKGYPPKQPRVRSSKEL